MIPARIREVGCPSWSRTIKDRSKVYCIRSEDRWHIQTYRFQYTQIYTQWWIDPSRVPGISRKLQFIYDDFTGSRERERERERECGGSHDSCWGGAQVAQPGWQTGGNEWPVWVTRTGTTSIFPSLSPSVTMTLLSYRNRGGKIPTRSFQMPHKYSGWEDFLFYFFFP